MVATAASEVAAIRANLGHPIIDSDRHVDPLDPDFLDYIRQVGGTKVADRYQAATAAGRTSRIRASPSASILLRPLLR